ncbi:flagellin [Pararhizobium sp. LjRoot255]|uniref:flagellin n=1 Tax=Pararhizobium sp. LjRoot255 TaxID=3342298 RepID=UPI003ECC897B
MDADMSDASIRLKAIQSQVQLAVQALNIANNAPSLLMQLFQQATRSAERQIRTVSSSVISLRQ